MRDANFRELGTTRYVRERRATRLSPTNFTDYILESKRAEGADGKDGVVGSSPTPASDFSLLRGASVF